MHIPALADGKGSTRGLTCELQEPAQAIICNPTYRCVLAGKHSWGVGSLTWQLFLFFPRAREKQQPWAQPCDQPFAALEGTTRLSLDAGLLGRAVFYKNKTSSAIKRVSMPNDISPALLHSSGLDHNSFKIKIIRSVYKKLIQG